MHRKQLFRWSAAICGSMFLLLFGQPLSTQGFCRKCKHAPPSCDEANKAWEKYKRDLKIVTGLFQDADSEDLRAMAEFDSVADDIDDDMAMGLRREYWVDALDMAAQQGDLSKIAELERQATVQIRQGEIDLADKTYEEIDEEITNLNVNAEGTATIEVGIQAELIHMAIWWDMYHQAVANIDRSEQSQIRMLKQADDKWRQVLNDYYNAIAQDAQCTAAKKHLADEQDLERRAAHYIENLEGGYHRPDGSWQRQWVIHNRAYNDYQSAINAAKQIVGGPSSSGSLMRRGRVHLQYASAGITPEARDTVRLTLVQAQRLDTLLKRAAGDIRRGGVANTALVNLYVANWRATHAWIARITKPRS